jgi:hypothetical protein
MVLKCPLTSSEARHKQHSHIHTNILLYILDCALDCSHFLVVQLCMYVAMLLMAGQTAGPFGPKLSETRRSSGDHIWGVG